MTVHRGMYPLVEIFRSIQGEGVWTGCEAVFVRFAGCNLACPWCDTELGMKFTASADEIATQVWKLLAIEPEHMPLVVFTGGEPTLRHLTPIAMALTRSGCPPIRLHLETNGSTERWQEIQSDPRFDWITVSPKSTDLNLAALRWLQMANEIKVVFDGQIDPAKLKDGIPPALFAAQQCFIQPCSANYGPALEYVMKHPEWRLGIQVHKVIEGCR